MQNDMLTTAEKLKSLRDQKAELEEQVKAINAEIEETDQRLCDMMVDSETQNFTHSGVQFSLTSKIRASAIAERKQDLFYALRKNGFGSLIQENVNANSLSAFVKEQMEEGEDELPFWLEDLVSVYQHNTVSLRKTRK